MVELTAIQGYQFIAVAQPTTTLSQCWVCLRKQWKDTACLPG